MDSAPDTECSHPVGSPIRISPDHRLPASPRGFSQLATSFFACLRQGIPTHALRSLTIKFTHNTEQTYILFAPRRIITYVSHGAVHLCMPVSIQLSKIG